jgi:hypothetical protein
MDYESRHHGLFVGFAPFDNPKIAAAAIVEHGCHGSSAATPVVEAVITQYMKKYQPEMYLKNLEQDKAIRESWVKSLKAANTLPANQAQPVAAPADGSAEE